MGLTSIDWIIMAVYFVFVLGIGVSLMLWPDRPDARILP
jgi:hypothetical protein